MKTIEAGALKRLCDVYYLGMALLGGAFTLKGKYSLLEVNGGG